MPKLLAGLADLLSRPPLVEHSICEVSKRYEWLLQAAARGVERVVLARHQFARDPVCLEILFKLRSARDWREEVRDIKTDFANLIPAWPELNRDSFWYDVRASRRRLFSKRPGDRLTWYRQASVFGAFWSFATEDFEYACESVTRQTEQEDKLVALTLAFDLYVKGGRTRPWRLKLKALTQGDAELTERLGILFKPPRPEWREQEQKLKRQSAARQRRDKANFEKSRIYLQSHLEAIRNPVFEDPASISQSQWWLHDWIRAKMESNSDWVATKWELLIPEFGDDVARAYQEGLVSYWRKFRPVIQSEGATDEFGSAYRYLRTERRDT